MERSVRYRGVLMVYLVLAGAAVIVQVVVTVIAFRLTRVTGKHYVWVFLVGAAGLMLFRRIVPFLQRCCGFNPGYWDWLSEVCGLVISVLLLVGALWVIPRISGIARSRDEIAEEYSTVAQIVRDNSIATFVLDRNHKVTHWNRACENLTGISASDIKGTTEAWRAFYEKQRPTLSDLLLDEAAPETIINAYSGDGRPSSIIDEGWEVEAFFPGLRGGAWLFFTACVLRDTRGEITGAIETLQDITESRRTSESLSRNVHRLRTLHTIVRNISTEQTAAELSQKLASLLAEHLHYRNVTFLRNEAGAGKTKLCIIGSSGLGKDRYAKLSKQIRETDRGLTLRAAKEMRIINTPDVEADPGFVPFDAGTISELDVPIVEGDRLLGVICVEGEAPFATEDEEVFSLIAGHIASRWTTLELMDELKTRSRSDQLTGLANRYALFEHIGAEQSRLERYGGSCTIIMADMANFKQLNDTYGHMVGDHCLKAAAGYLKKALRESDFVARYGGDEFVIIMQSMSEAELETFLERLREGLGELKVNGMDLGLEADIGVAVWPGDSRKIVKVLKAADDRMYENKRKRQTSAR